MTEEPKKTNAFIKAIKNGYECGVYAAIRPVAHLVSERMIEDTEKKARPIFAISSAALMCGFKYITYPADPATNTIAGYILLGGVASGTAAAIAERFISGTKPCSANLFNNFTKEREDNLNLRSFVEKRKKILEKHGRTDLLDKLAAKEQQAFDKLQAKKKSHDR